jgi:hypothetical protein
MARRMKAHKRAAVKVQTRLYRAWRKYGAPSVMVLRECLDNELDAREIEMIAALGTYSSDGYNATPGGDRSPSMCPEVAARIGAALRGR